MAITWQEAEEKILSYLEDRFGQSFSKEKLPIESQGKTEQCEFDAVSGDRKIVAEVKAYTCPYYNEEMLNAYSDVLRLDSVEADKKLMFLTDPLFYMAFCRKNKDELVNWRRQGIEIVSPFELLKYLE